MSEPKRPTEGPEPQKKTILNRDDLFPFPRPWLRLLIGVLYVVAALFLLRHLMPLVGWLLGVVSPFLIGLVLAYILYPVVGWIQKELRLGRIGAILAMALMVVAVLTGLSVWLLPVLYQQLSEALSAVRVVLVENIDQWVIAHMSEETLDQVKERIDEVIDQLQQLSRETLMGMGGQIKPVAAGGAQAVETIAGGIARGLQTVFGFFGTAALVVIVTFYYLAEMESIPGVIRRMLPADRRDQSWDLMQKSDRAVGGFLRGQLMTCMVMGTLTGLLLFLVGMGEYAILVGCFAGAMNLVPYLGVAAGITPALLWGLMSPGLGWWDHRGLVLIYIIGGFTVIQMIEGMILQPIIVGKQASLHPLAVMLALVLGAQAGLVGMIVAVPVACVVQVLWIELFWKGRDDEAGANSSREPQRAGSEPPAAGT